MPAPLMPYDELVERLLETFRERGYDGATLADVSAATKLGKSSLYHYFPGGKQDMGAAVLALGAAWLERELIGALKSDRSPERRLEAMFAAIRAFYAGGERACILGALTAGTARELYQQQLSQAFRHWMQALAHMLTEAGVDAPTARELSEDVVITVQGALVVSRGTGDTDFFRNALRRVHARLKEALGDVAG